MKRATAAEIKLGAIYRFGARYHLSQPDVAGLIEVRLGMAPAKAAQLAAHWFTSEPYRRKAG